MPNGYREFVLIPEIDQEELKQDIQRLAKKEELKAVKATRREIKSFVLFNFYIDNGEDDRAQKYAPESHNLVQRLGEYFYNLPQMREC